MAKHIKVGQKGEELAIGFLRKHGHKILETNWRFERYEVDIISKYKNLIVFTEVKARSGSDFGNPEDAVTTTKQRFLGKAADEYIYLKKYDGEFRFDIISIEFKSGGETEILHLEDAFFPIG